MVRKSLLVVMLLAAGAPAGAQEYQWTSKRPDGQAPLGVLDAQMLGGGQARLSYRFTQMDFRGVWLDNDSLTLAETFNAYPVAPLTLSSKVHEVGLAYAPTSDFTLNARITYAERQREQLTSDGAFYYITNAKELGDLEVTGLYQVFHQAGYLAHLQLGALIPTGVYDGKAETPFSSPNKEPLPYDMRAGGGSFAVLPGLTLMAQNEMASVGAQVRGTFYVDTNGADYRPGNVYDFTGWAAYRLNDYFSVSGRARYLRWDGIDGQDPGLDPLRDPGNDAYFLKGRRLDIPVGLNVYLPEGMHLGGNRLSMEYTRTVSQHYRGPQLGADWGISLGWQTVF
jgi:hypothetical protein